MSVANVVHQKWPQDDVHWSLVRNEEVDEQEQIGGDVRLFAADGFDPLGDPVPFTFQLFAEADDQNLQA